MISGGVFLLEGSKIKTPPGYCIGVLGQSLRLFDQYQLCCGVHLLGEPEHISLAVGVKPACSQQNPQGQFFQGILCWKVLQQVLTEENNLAKT